MLICKISFSGADTVRFKAEINFDGREITRRHLSRKETAQLLLVCNRFDAGMVLNGSNRD